MNEICPRCKDEDDDHRTLYMSCFYEMDELKIPFQKDELYETSDPREDATTFYTMRVCKSCRSDWMKAIKHWFENYEAPISCGSGIFIRDFGANREVTLEEFNKLQEKMKNE